MTEENTRRTRWVLAAAALCTLALSAPAARAEDPAVAAARGVLERFIGPRAAEWELVRIPEADGQPVFEVEAAEGTVTVRGSSGVAISRGAYTYLREACHAMFTWGGQRLDLPDTWPDYPRKRVVCPFRLVLMNNICTSGYTTPYFGWAEWERYLDWMALHGCNLQMTPLGSEAIWARVWRQFGVTDEELSGYFTGPAFLPWHRMGNINGHGGPLPAGYHQRAVALQKQILQRMRGLGMHPIAPAFSGFVPAGFKRAQPDAQVLDMEPWAGFPRGNAAHILHPASPLYATIGQAYVQAWQAEFGDADYYRADSFNEMQVPVSGSPEQQLEQLAGFGESVYRGIAAGDPEGTWVMMAWLFLDGFWTPERSAALLSRVPDDKMLILDLFCESLPQWKRMGSFFGKQWIWSILPNFGGNSQLMGPLDDFAKTIPTVSRMGDRGNLVGFGMSPEGTENNEVIYELASDAAWSTEPIVLPDWLEGYCRARYGAFPPAVQKAWTLLTQSVYAGGHGSVNHLLQRRPRENSYGPVWRCDDRLGQAAELMIAAAPAFADNPLFVNDVLEMAGQYLGDRVGLRLDHCRIALEADAPDLAARYMRDAQEVMQGIDALLGAHTLHRMDRWVAMARAWGANPAERDAYEEDSKRILTVWGSSLSEYAARYWNGLIDGYYAPRWQAWYDATRRGEDFDQSAWEEAWITTPGNVTSRTGGDPLGLAQDLIELTRGWTDARAAEDVHGEIVASWKSGELSEAYTLREWDVSAYITRPGAYEILFRYTDGSHRLDIASVELVAEGEPPSRDAHEGTTGTRNQGNRYRLALERLPPGQRCLLRAMVKTAGGTDSNGCIHLRAVAPE